MDGISSVLDQPSVVTGTELDLSLAISCLPCIIILTELLREGLMFAGGWLVGDSPVLHVCTILRVAGVTASLAQDKKVN